MNALNAQNRWILPLAEGGKMRRGVRSQVIKMKLPEVSEENYKTIPAVLSDNFNIVNAIFSEQSIQSYRSVHKGRSVARLRGAVIVLVDYEVNGVATLDDYMWIRVIDFKFMGGEENMPFRDDLTMVPLKPVSNRSDCHKPKLTEEQNSCKDSEIEGSSSLLEDISLLTGLSEDYSGDRGVPEKSTDSLVISLMDCYISEPVQRILDSQSFYTRSNTQKSPENVNEDHDSPSDDNELLTDLDDDEEDTDFSPHPCVPEHHSSLEIFDTSSPRPSPIESDSEATVSEDSRERDPLALSHGNELCLSPRSPATLSFSQGGDGKAFASTQAFQEGGSSDDDSQDFTLLKKSITNDHPHSSASPPIALTDLSQNSVDSCNPFSFYDVGQKNNSFEVEQSQLSLIQEHNMLIKSAGCSSSEQEVSNSLESSDFSPLAGDDLSSVAEKFGNLGGRKAAARHGEPSSSTYIQSFTEKETGEEEQEENCTGRVAGNSPPPKVKSSQRSPARTPPSKKRPRSRSIDFSSWFTPKKKK